MNKKDQNKLILGLGLAGVGWLLWPKKAYAVEAGRTYRYSASINPPLSSEAQMHELASTMSKYGNTNIAMAAGKVSYDVTRQSSTTLTPGKVLALFGNSKVVFESAVPA